MIAEPKTTQEINSEIAALCAVASFPFECGAGGSLTSEIAIVAEAPGEREVQSRQPLIGVSGKVLWDVLRRHKLNRNMVYITNVVKRKMIHAAEDFDVAPKDKLVLPKSELALWRHILHEELQCLPNLRYVVALGNYALEALTGERGITQFRGSVLPAVIGGRTVQVICANNPAAVLHDPKLEIVFRMDMAKLVRVISGEFYAPSLTYHINPTYQRAMQFIDECTDTGDIIAHDIETMAEETACVGLALSDTEGMCINFRSQGSNHYSLEEERTLRVALQRLLGDHDKRFVAQNGNFDAYWMWFKDRIRVAPYWLDTMLAHHCLYPGLPHNLGFLTAQYTDYPYYKDEGKDWKEQGDINDFWRYNIKDACITRQVAQRLHAELIDQKLDEFFFEHVMPLQPHLIAMTVGGILCDVERKSAISAELAERVSQARELCQSKARAATNVDDYEFNPRSPRDLAKLFFDDLQLVGRGRSTDKENRGRMLRHPRTTPAARETIRAVDNYLAEAKFVSVYASARIDNDHRFRCEYKQTGVASAPGRLSSSQTMWGSGLNMQNIPERAKDMFICDPGYEFSYYDMSQIEARIVAYLADIPVWKAQYERARLHPGTYDAHRALASEMFGVPYDDTPSKDYGPGGHTIRYIAKRCRHGLNYRMQPDRLASVTGLSLDAAEQAYRLYHSATPEISLWWDRLTELVRRDRSITTCLGRRWLLLERYDDKALESIVAFEPQSINGDHTARVIEKCHNDPEWPPTARMAINVHDANIALNRIEDGELVRAIMRRHAEAPLYINSVENRLNGVWQPEPLVVPAEFGKSEPDDTGTHRWSTIYKLPYA